MRKALVLQTAAAVFCLMAGPARAALEPTVITQWDYNSYASDDPSIGTGSFGLVGQAERVSPLSVTWITIQTVGQGMGDGVYWSVSTAGYEQISLSLSIKRGDGYTGARDWTWQYFNGTNWIDGPDFHVVSYSQAETKTFDLTALADADNNTAFQFRVTRTTNGDFIGLGAMFDDVTVSGFAIPEPATLALLGLGVSALFRRRNA